MESNALMAGKTKDETLDYLTNARQDLAEAQSAQALAHLRVMVAEHHLVNLEIENLAV